MERPPVWTTGVAEGVGGTAVVVGEGVAVMTEGEERAGVAVSFSGGAGCGLPQAAIRRTSKASEIRWLLVTRRALPVRLGVCVLIRVIRFFASFVIPTPAASSV
jgi:hypothetical protein